MDSILMSNYRRCSGSMKLNFVTKIWGKIRNGWPRNWKAAIELLVFLVFQATYYVFAIGLIAYFICVLQHEPGNNVAFQMTAISGILGGLVLSGGLIKEDSPLGVGLRKVGICFIASALGFILFGLYAPLLDELPKDELSFKLSKLVFQLGFGIGIIGFSLATAYLAVLIPKLWRRE